MAVNELTKALYLEEVAAPRAIADALFTNVTKGVPLLRALIDSGSTTAETLTRHLARTDAPFLRHVEPLVELIERLPPGLPARLLALPIRRDPLTGTVDVAVADPRDPHAAQEIAFHLGAPVRVVRAPLAAIEEALRRLRGRPHDDLARQGRGGRDDDRIFDSRPRGPADLGARRAATLPPPEPALARSLSPASPRRGLLLETDSVPPPTPAATGRRIRTPPWGTPIHMLSPAPVRPATDPPAAYGSEIPIPLTRKTYGPGAIAAAVHGKASSGTQHPPRLAEPSVPPPSPPFGQFIPGPPALPVLGTLAAYPPRHAYPEIGSVLAALREASSRDQVLELVLSGARAVARKVALFVVKRGSYVGWRGTPEFADRTALEGVVVPLDADTLFDRAVREDLYLGPIHPDAMHGPLLRAMRNPSRDVAAVPIRVSGRTAVVIVADELEDTMTGTRLLAELARASGEAFARIVRTRR